MAAKIAAATASPRPVLSKKLITVIYPSLAQRNRVGWLRSPKNGLTSFNSAIPPGKCPPVQFAAVGFVEATAAVLPPAWLIPRTLFLA
jgi:hypothetical protein